jgi:hypothetical protein
MPWKPQVSASADAAPTTHLEQLKAEQHPDGDDAQRTIFLVVRTAISMSAAGARPSANSKGFVQTLRMLIVSTLDVRERQGFDP